MAISDLATLVSRMTTATGATGVSQLGDGSRRVSELSSPPLSQRMFIYKVYNECKILNPIGLLRKIIKNSEIPSLFFASPTTSSLKKKRKNLEIESNDFECIYVENASYFRKRKQICCLIRQKVRRCSFRVLSIHLLPLYQRLQLTYAKCLCSRTSTQRSIHSSFKWFSGISTNSS